MIGDIRFYSKTTTNIPKNLVELGLCDLSDTDIQEIAVAALTDPSAGGNPRELTIADTRALLESCL